MGSGAGLLGMPLATYTGVLLGNSAVPVWLATRKTLPLLFGASSVASLGALLELLPLERRELSIARRMGIMGRVAELLATKAVEIDAHENAQVGRPLRTGVSGALWVAAKVLTVSSLAVSLAPGRGRRQRTAIGVLGVLGGMALRFAVFHAGKASARDPRATFVQQRQGVLLDGAASAHGGVDDQLDV